MSLIEDIKKEEGYSAYPYNDTLNNPTIGYGTLLPLGKDEAELILEYRLKKFIDEVNSSLYFLEEDNKEVWDILYHMAYQMGTKRLLKFKNMLTALENKDYEEASKQMLDSLWAKQTPNRAKRLADRMKNIV